MSQWQHGYGDSRHHGRSRQEQPSPPITVKLDGQVPIGEEQVGGRRGVSVFLVKFYFTNSAHLPPGIPGKDRPSNDEMDAYHASIMACLGEQAKNAIGRIREGRIDTGECVIQNAPLVQVGVLRRGFAANRLRLLDAHWFEQEARQSGHKPKYVVCLTFAEVRSVAGGEFPKLPRATEDALRVLANTTWQFCHVWDNTPIPISTINCVGRQPDAVPRHAIVVRGKVVQAIAVTARIQEADEAV